MNIKKIYTQQSQCLKALTTKAIRKSLVKHIFQVATATQRLIDNGLPPDYINDYFNLAISSTKETKLIICSNTRFYTT